MGSEQVVTTVTPTPPVDRSVPGFYFSESTAQPASRNTETAVPVFLFNAKTDDAPPQKVRSFAAFLSVSKEIEGDAFKSAVKGYFENGGAGCYIAPAPLSLGDVGQAEVKIIKIINALPDCTLIGYPHDIESAFSKPTWCMAWTAILLACKVSGRCFALIDLPTDEDEAKTLLGLLKSASEAALGYGAAFWPPVKVEGGSVVLPSGMIAAAIEKTDRDRGIWKAPANVTLANAYDTTADVMKKTSLFTNPEALGVNAIRVFPGRGVKVWGCRTLMPKQSANRSFVQTSRMLSYVQNNLQRLSRFAVFEPSNEITWVKLHNIIYAWLHALWLKGGLVGAAEKEAFRVLVGKHDSMTDADLLKGELKVDIAFALQQPLQFIHLQIRMAGNELSVTNPSNAGGTSQ